MVRVASSKTVDTEAVGKWRRNLPKDSQRVVLHEAKSDLPRISTNEEGEAELPTQRTGPVKIADPRAVVDAMEGDLARWVRTDPTAMPLMRAIMRNKPEFQHLTNDELDEHIAEWLRTAGRESTERAYKAQGYDRGSNLDMQRGLWLPSQT